MKELTNEAYRELINKYCGSRLNKNLIYLYNKYLSSLCMSLNPTENYRTDLTEIYQ